MGRWGWLDVGLLVVLAGLVCGGAGCGIGAQGEVPMILTCYHAGVPVVEAPAVEDFMLRQQGTMVEARWTNPETREREVVVTTLPCLYRVTAPPEDARPAN
jgi:hypothetical protein